LTRFKVTGDKQHWQVTKSPKLLAIETKNGLLRQRLKVKNARLLLPLVNAGIYNFSVLYTHKPHACLAPEDDH
jgi:hypothetical protein